MSTDWFSKYNANILLEYNQILRATYVFLEIVPRYAIINVETVTLSY